MPRAGPRTVRRYSAEFKLTAVRLREQPGIQVKTVAAALAIHPFMLSTWRKDAREGTLAGTARTAPRPGPARESARLQALERAHALLQEEHALLKKGHPVLFRSKADIFAFIDAERAREGGTYRVTRLCRPYGVTRAGYYAWSMRGATARSACTRSRTGTSSLASRGSSGPAKVATGAPACIER